MEKRMESHRVARQGGIVNMNGIILGQSFEGTRQLHSNSSFCNYILTLLYIANRRYSPLNIISFLSIASKVNPPL